MHKYILPLLLLLFFQTHFVKAQSGCPGCMVDLPPLPADTIYLGNAPDGVAGEPYDGDLSFRMPKTTDPVHDVDPSTPAGLNIGNITIIALLNVPPGLSWEPNKFSFDPGDETDGCVKFCGTPVLPGDYEVQVFVTASVLGINQSTSFSFDFHVAPSTSTTDGFAMQNSAGCGEVTTSFQNNIISNGNTGFDYFWDFGNGQTSTDENPDAVTYSTPGVYEVNYEAIIDTSGYELVTVQITDAGCNDLNLPPISNAPPELYIKIKDPSGNQIYQSGEINNAPLPSAFNVNIPIGMGDYTLEVRDNDLIGSDHCGTVTFNRMSTDTLKDGDLGALVDIFHPVFSIQSTDTVFVYEQPTPPVISPDGMVEVCEGGAVELTADYADGIQWYQDSSVVLGATEPTLAVNSNGSYWVEYTSPEGCSAVSDVVVFNQLPLPAPPSFSESGNWLSVVDVDNLPAEYALQWLINGDTIPDETGTSYCNTTDGVNLFALVVTDLATGCTNEFSLGVAYDPDADCTVAAKEVEAIANSLNLYPNPTNDWLHIVFENEKPAPVSIDITDVMGRVFISKNTVPATLSFYEKMDVNGLASGIYFVRISTEEGAVVRRFVKE